MRRYFDTSFLVSLYVRDAHSASAIASVSTINEPMLLTSFGELELTNALHLRRFRRELGRRQLNAALAAFHTDLRHGIYAVRTLPESVFVVAMRLVARRTATLGVRTLDILHVASAVSLNTEVFYTFDQRQGELAAAEGLRLG